MKSEVVYGFLGWFCVVCFYCLWFELMVLFGVMRVILLVSFDCIVFGLWVFIFVVYSGLG